MDQIFLCCVCSYHRLTCSNSICWMSASLSSTSNRLLNTRRASWLNQTLSTRFLPQSIALQSIRNLAKFGAMLMNSRGKSITLSTSYRSRRQFSKPSNSFTTSTRLTKMLQVGINLMWKTFKQHFLANLRSNHIQNSSLKFGKLFTTRCLQMTSAGD